MLEERPGKELGKQEDGKRRFDTACKTLEAGFMKQRSEPLE
jgi:hypothetical protein